MCQIDVRDVWRGRESAAWVLSFVERVILNPQSIVRARIRAEPKPDQRPADPKSPVAAAWSDWYGWDHVATKIAEQSDILLAVNGNKHTVWRPSIVRAKPVVGTMEQAAAQLFFLLAQN